MSSIEKVVVVGTGFIGLPLAIMLAYNGKTVVGVDINESTVRAINNGTLNLDEGELEELLDDETVKENLIAKTEPTDGDAYVISVPTPLSMPSQSPDLSYVMAAIESVLPYLSGGDILNIESTVPPLTIETEVVELLEEHGFTPGEDVHVAHSPERILPGNVFEEIVHNDRIIGGLTDDCSRKAAEIYEPFLEGEVYRTDLTSAEMCKLIENIYRDVNVALANELALISENLDIDIGAVIDLANNHPRVDLLRPGIGVGGHCLPVDPWFLNEVDPEHTNIITSARRINDTMPTVAAGKIRQAVSSYSNPKILTLGAAYKPNTHDERNSPANEIVESLRTDGYRVAHYDRHVEAKSYQQFAELLEDERPDVVVQLVPHDETVAEIQAAAAKLESTGVEVFQFGVKSWDI